MTPETTYAKQVIDEAMANAANERGFDKDMLGRALIAAVIDNYKEYRKLSDIASELQFIIDNLDEDEFVITRGC